MGALCRPFFFFFTCNIFAYCLILFWNSLGVHNGLSYIQCILSDICVRFMFNKMNAWAHGTHANCSFIFSIVSGKFLQTT
jgi:hypothetical protein